MEQFDHAELIQKATTLIVVREIDVSDAPLCVEQIIHEDDNFCEDMEECHVRWVLSKKHLRFKYPAKGLF